MYAQRGLELRSRRMPAPRPATAPGCPDAGRRALAQKPPRTRRSRQPACCPSCASSPALKAVPRSVPISRWPQRTGDSLVQALARPRDDVLAGADPGGKASRDRWKSATCAPAHRHARVTGHREPPVRTARPHQNAASATPSRSPRPTHRAPAPQPIRSRAAGRDRARARCAGSPVPPAEVSPLLQQRREIEKRQPLTGFLIL